MKNNIATYAIFADEGTASDAMEALKGAGFRATDVSVLRSQNSGSMDFAHEKHSKAPEGAVMVGAMAGALVGAAGWLVGAGSIVVPGLETAAAAGPAIVAMSGVGLGTILGGLAGAIGGTSVPEYEAKRFMGRVRKGGVLVSVHCDNMDWAKTASRVLKENGGTQISTGTEAKADFARSEKPMRRTRMTTQ